MKREQVKIIIIIFSQLACVPSNMLLCSVLAGMIWPILFIVSSSLCNDSSVKMEVMSNC